MTDAPVTNDDIEAMLLEQAPLDPLSPLRPWYRPSPTGARFHASPTYFKLLRGGGRTGKTTAGLVDLAWCMRGIHPYKPWCGPFTSIIFAVSRQQAAMVTQKKLLDQCELPSMAWLPDRLRTGATAGRVVLASDAAVTGRADAVIVDIGQQPLIPQWEIADIGAVKVGFRSVHWVKLHNGCELYFSWSGAEETWKRIQGPKIGYIYVDENAGQRKLIIEARKRLMDSQHKNTWHGTMTWGAHGTEDNDAFEDFVTRAQDPLDKDHQLFQMIPGETGAVTEEAIERFAKTLTADERKIHITGEESVQGLVQVFKKQWSDERNYKAYAVEETDNLWVSYDPGVDHPTGMIVGAINKRWPRRLFIAWETMRRGGTIHDDVRELAVWLNGRRLAGFVYDTNLKNRDRAGGPSVLTQMKDALSQAGIVPTAGFYQSKKNHLPGINLMRDMLMPGSDPTAAPLLIVTPQCPQTRSQIMKYRGKEETRFTGAGGVVKKDDELVDCARYLCMQQPSWREVWTCGRGHLAVVELDADLPRAPVARGPSADELARTELSAAAAERRQSRGRVRGFGDVGWRRWYPAGPAGPAGGQGI